MEMFEQGNQSSYALYHIILLTLPTDKHNYCGTEAFQENWERSWHGTSDHRLPVQCSEMSTNFALAHHCHPLCSRCNCPQDAQSSPRISKSFHKTTSILSIHLYTSVPPTDPLLSSLPAPYAYLWMPAPPAYPCFIVLL